MGILLRRRVKLDAMDVILNFMISENDLFGVDIQNWMFIVMSITIIWCSLCTFCPKPSAKLMLCYWCERAI
jgi:hypothetical protein